MVSLAQFMEGMPTVSVDSYLGMRALLAHLIDVHKFQRLAFLRGPEEHYYAQERYRAYLNFLQAYNLPLDPKLVTRPLPWEAGVEAIEILLDERGVQTRPGLRRGRRGERYDGDLGYEDAAGRGFDVPKDITVTGFNNSMQERLATPPLTTVDLPV